MKLRNKRKLFTVFVLLLAVFTGIQFIRPRITHPEVTRNVTVPPDVEAILRRACYDCHSNETQLKWFDEIAPASWLVASHIKEGREVLNFSEWDKLVPADQKGKLFLSINKIREKEMPLGSYVMLHGDAALSAEDVKTIEQYLASASPRKPADSTAISALTAQYNQLMNQPGNIHPPVTAQPAPNGIEYITGYRDWEAISTTDRFDNGTMRVIYGNDIAVKAIKENHINPWPDGAVFAKVAWAQLGDTAGNIRTGEFKQVEFMIKDSKKYADTKGWGWARWKGMDLKPYGKNASFTKECVSCHQPMKDNDFVFTMPLNLKTP